MSGIRQAAPRAPAFFYAGEAAGVLYNRCGSLIAAEGKSPLVRTASGVTQCRAVAARMGTCR